MTGLRKRTISDMAREAQLPYFYQTGETANLPQLEAFAELVRADERKLLASESERNGNEILARQLRARGEQA